MRLLPCWRVGEDSSVTMSGTGRYDTWGIDQIIVGYSQASPHSLPTAVATYHTPPGTPKHPNLGAEEEKPSATFGNGQITSWSNTGQTPQWI